MGIKSWIKSASLLLNELAEIDFGYPLGENIIRSPKNKDIVQLSLSNVGYSNDKTLYDFYLTCDGLSWPDVNNGYFINSIEKFNGKELLQKMVPVKITGAYADSIMVFGSDGGGGLFAIRKSQNDILYLPTGPVKNGVFDGNAGKVQKIGDNFSEFLKRLLDDLRAFVLDEEGYIYIS